MVTASEPSQILFEDVFFKTGKIPEYLCITLKLLYSEVARDLRIGDGKTFILSVTFYGVVTPLTWWRHGFQPSGVLIKVAHPAHY